MTENEMTNQAAQTMPVIDDFNGDNAKLIESARALISLSDSGSLAPHGIGGHARAILSAFIARTEAAALSQTAGVADGWKLVPVEPTEVMCEAAMSSLGWTRSEAAAKTAPITPASPMMEGSMKVWSAMLAAAPAASGAHPDSLPDGTLSKSTAKRVMELAAAPVSERARELLAAQYRHDPEFAATIIEGTGMDSVTYALRAITAALTQQRGDDVESAARALFEEQADRLAAPWDRQWEPTKEHWRNVARGNLYATTPHPSADAVREVPDGMEELREKIEALQEFKPWAHKNTDSRKGFVTSMRKAKSPEEGEEYGWVNKGTILALLSAASGEKGVG